MRSLAIGNFDGVHLGHQSLIHSAQTHKPTPETTVAVVTFDPHPREALNPGLEIPRLCSIEERIHRLKSLGVGEVFVIPFNKDFAQTSARDFFESYLIQKWDAHHVSVGTNFYFGNDRKGTPQILKSWMESMGRHATIIEPVSTSNLVISSSAIRQSLEKGDVFIASIMLGRHYSIKGLVSSGFKKGRGIGFPTANLYPLSGTKPSPCLPLEGVYATVTKLPSGKFIDSITNIGFRPTMNDNSPLSMETHLLNFDGDLYGQSISVNFIDRIRPELKFSSLDALKSQIIKDIEDCIKIHQKTK